MRDIDDTQQPLLEHLIELRRRLLYCVAALLVTFFASFYFSKEIYGFLVHPLAVAGQDQVIFTQIFGAFFVQLKAKGLLKGANHNDITGTPGCGALGFLKACANGVYGYMGFPTAWLAWQLKGDAVAGAAFKNGTGEFFTANAWTGRISNIP